ADGARGGADQVVAVDSTDPLRECGERKPDAGGRAEERQRKQRIEDGKKEKLPWFPDHGERIERKALGPPKARDPRYGEQGGAGGKSRTEVAAQPVAHNCEQGTARAVAEQGD